MILAYMRLVARIYRKLHLRPLAWLGEKQVSWYEHKRLYRYYVRASVASALAMLGLRYWASRTYR